ncbi:transcriptional regulator, AbrB family [Parvibaculum lavamentivorans DS-1]|uniref:Transcriptional regulator, AbrB family n=1 Tax=Parvibaculum lavamentivorans (strain DS-1 / DSM 13023 / NCIMB 13966) TaxID=402881 RepID=A7HWC1_PARL1|nr:AbrB/MazE/SpoVT family DNA-binding domain-containing protein [Parvibaculum lavamentivorans]ABS64204.1 transcriptional regulator, AbrB family [Parvibaculum lavamentivorans DS-1]
MGTIVTSKGQVTIPKAVRDRLGIKPGTEVQFEPTEDGRFLLTTAGRKRSLKKSPFARLRGTATVKMSTEEIMALTRGES